MNPGIGQKNIGENWSEQDELFDRVNLPSEEEIKKQIIKKEELEESFSRGVGSSNYQQAELAWREQIQNENWEGTEEDDETKEIKIENLGSKESKEDDGFELLDLLEDEEVDDNYLEDMSERPIDDKIRTIKRSIEVKIKEQLLSKDSIKNDRESEESSGALIEQSDNLVEEEVVPGKDNGEGDIESKEAKEDVVEFPTNIKEFIEGNGSISWEKLIDRVKFEIEKARIISSNNGLSIENRAFVQSNNMRTILNKEYLKSNKDNRVKNDLLEKGDYQECLNNFVESRTIYNNQKELINLNDYLRDYYESILDINDSIKIDLVSLNNPSLDFIFKTEREYYHNVAEKLKKLSTQTKIPVLNLKKGNTFRQIPLLSSNDFRKEEPSNYGGSVAVMANGEKTDNLIYVNFENSIKQGNTLLEVNTTLIHEIDHAIMDYFCESKFSEINKRIDDYKEGLAGKDEKEDIIDLLFESNLDKVNILERGIMNEGMARKAGSVFLKRQIDGLEDFSDIKGFSQATNLINDFGLIQNNTTFHLNYLIGDILCTFLEDKVLMKDIYRSDISEKIFSPKVIKNLIKFFTKEINYRVEMLNNIQESQYPYYNLEKIKKFFHLSFNSYNDYVLEFMLDNKYVQIYKDQWVEIRKLSEEEVNKKMELFNNKYGEKEISALKKNFFDNRLLLLELELIDKGLSKSMREQYKKEIGDLLEGNDSNKEEPINIENDNSEKGEVVITEKDNSSNELVDILKKEQFVSVLENLATNIKGYHDYHGVSICNYLDLEHCIHQLSDALDKNIDINGLDSILNGITDAVNDKIEDTGKSTEDSTHDLSIVKSSIADIGDLISKITTHSNEKVPSLRSLQDSFDEKVLEIEQIIKKEDEWNEFNLFMRRNVVPALGDLFSNINRANIDSIFPYSGALVDDLDLALNMKNSDMIESAIIDIDKYFRIDSNSRQTLTSEELHSLERINQDIDYVEEILFKASKNGPDELRKCLQVLRNTCYEKGEEITRIIRRARA